MKLRLSIFAAAGGVAMLAFVGGCSSTTTEPNGNGGTGGAAQSAAGHAGVGQGGGGTSSTSGGSGGTGMAGTSASAAGAANVDCSSFTGSTPAPTFCNFKFVILNVNPQCGGASPCHGVGGTNPLVLPKDDDAQLLHNMTALISPDCGNIPIITPGDPTNSALVKVLKGPCSVNVPEMPYGCDPASNNCVPSNFEQAIEQWISAGAKLE